MTKIKKTLSPKKREDGKQQVLFQVNINRTARPRIKSGVWVLASLFNQKTGEIIIPKRGKLNIVNREEASKSESELKNAANVIDRIVSAIEAHIENPTSDQIEHIRTFYQLGALTLYDKNGDVINWPSIEKALEDERKAKRIAAHDGIDPAALSDIYHIIEFYVNHHRRINTQEPMSDVRRTQFMTLSRLVQRFELYVQLTKEKDYKFDYETCTNIDLEMLRDYLLNEGSLALANPLLFEEILSKAPLSLNVVERRTLTNRGSNYMAKLMKNLKCIFLWMKDNDITKNDPFKKFCTGEQIYGKPIYITLEEREQIAHTDLSKECATLQEQRDIFVFQCQTGCRVSDLLSLTPGNIQNDMLEYVPSKTSRSSNQAKPRIPLTAACLDIVAKYRDNIHCMGKLLPFVSAQKYNVYIKEILKLCGIDRNVSWRNPRTGQYELRPIYEVATTHMARKTFIGNAYKRCKDPALIARMSGHTEHSKSFCRYRDIDDDDLRELINKM